MCMHTMHILFYHIYKRRIEWRSWTSKANTIGLDVETIGEHSLKVPGLHLLKIFGPFCPTYLHLFCLYFYWKCILLAILQQFAALDFYCLFFFVSCRYLAYTCLYKVVFAIFRFFENWLYLFSIFCLEKTKQKQKKSKLKKQNKWKKCKWTIPFFLLFFCFLSFLPFFFPFVFPFFLLLCFLHFADLLFDVSFFFFFFLFFKFLEKLELRVVWPT